MQVITRQELADWLDGLAREQTLIGPRDVEGVLLDLTARQPVPPTPELLQTFHLIPRAADFEVLSELRRGVG